MIKIKFWILFVSIVCVVSAHAGNVRGFITNLEKDTIWGYVQVSRFNQVTGGLILNGIELESFNSRVVFKADQTKRFKTYFPEMITGFGFRYKSEVYIYRQQEVKHSNMFSGESYELKFLRNVDPSNVKIHFEELEVDQ